MRSHKSRRITTWIDIPRGANIWACAVGRGQRPIHDISGTVFRLFHHDHFIFAPMPEQRLGQLLLIGHRETETHEKSRFAATGGMGRV